MKDMPQKYYNKLKPGTKGDISYDSISVKGLE
jgi:hypothetical protein